MRKQVVEHLGQLDFLHAKENVWFTDDRLTHIVYPLPGAWQMLDAKRPSPARLEALLGKQRSLILRELARPMTAGAVAELLIAVPSAATHDLRILERAGLVERRDLDLLGHLDAPRRRQGLRRL